MQKNSITNKISPCCNLPFSVVYWWVTNLTLNSEYDREFIISKISQNGTISIEGWKVLANSATLESDASFTKQTLLSWFDCGRQPSCEQLKMIIEGLVLGSWTPEIELLYTNDTLADDVLKRISIDGKSDMNLKEVTTWYDGTPMTDARVDNKVFWKKNGKYYQIAVDPKQLLKINTIAELRNFDGYYEGQEITLLGYSVSGDKEPINYKFTSNKGVDDGGCVINSSKGSWIAQYSTSLRTSVYGGGMGFITIEDINELIIDNIVTLSGNITFKENLTLNFQGGKFKNGTVVGVNNIISNLGVGSFENTDISGSFIISEITHDSFVNYDNDVKKLSAIFNLGFNGTHRTDIDLGDVEYDITSTNYNAYSSIWLYQDISNKSLINANTTFNDTRLIQNSLERLLAVLTFDSCSDIKIRGNYVNRNTDINLDTELGYKGYTFIQTYRNCSGIDVHVNVENARFGHRHGDFNKHWLNGDIGLFNSKIIITAYQTSYPVSVELGDKNDLTVYSEKHHRAVYSCGLSRSNIYIKGKDIYIAPSHCLISDSRYSLTEGGTIVYKSPSDLNVVVEDIGTTYANNADPVCVNFQAYNLFTSRTTPLMWKNINVTVINESNLVSDFHFTRSVDNTAPFNVNDTFENIKINAIHRTSTSKFNRVVFSNYCTYKNISFILDTPNGNIIIDNANASDVLLIDSTINNLYYAGKIFLLNSTAVAIPTFNSNIGVSNKDLKLRNSKIPFIASPQAITLDSDFNSYRSYNANHINGKSDVPMITYDEPTKRPKLWNMSAWTDVNGRTIAPLLGTSFPWTVNANVLDRGFEFYRTDQNKSYMWTVSGWKNILLAEVSTAVADVSSNNATDLATALTLVNELKEKLNAKLAADRTSGQQAT